MTLAALSFTWRSRPARLADCLVSAIQKDDYDAADRLFQNPDDKTFVRWSAWQNLEFPTELAIAATREPQSWSDNFYGTCVVNIQARFLGGGANACISGPLIVTALGAQTPPVGATMLASGPKIGMETFYSRVSKDKITRSTAPVKVLAPDELAAIMRTVGRTLTPAAN